MLKPNSLFFRRTKELIKKYSKRYRTIQDAIDILEKNSIYLSDQFVNLSFPQQKELIGLGQALRQWRILLACFRDEKLSNFESIPTVANKRIQYFALLKNTLKDILIANRQNCTNTFPVGHFWYPKNWNSNHIKIVTCPKDPSVLEAIIQKWMIDNDLPFKIDL